jgi:hypothetical protein
VLSLPVKPLRAIPMVNININVANIILRVIVFSPVIFGLMVSGREIYAFLYFALSLYQSNHRLD